jgi:hypothetical protein
LWISSPALIERHKPWHPCFHGTDAIWDPIKHVPAATKQGSENGSNGDHFFVVLDQRAILELLVTRLGQESFDAEATITRIRGFDGESPSRENNFCCVDSSDEISEFRGLVEINGDQYFFIAQINSKDQHRARFIPTQEVLADPSGKPRKMQSIIQKMILGRKRGVVLIPECEDEAIDVIAGLIEQGFHELAADYRDVIISQLEKAKVQT